MEDFTPCSILDVTSILYCSFCFKANELTKNSPHPHRLNQCPFYENLVPLYGEYCEGYWPPSWPKPKVLSYKHLKCQFDNCKFKCEKLKELAMHVKSKHSRIVTEDFTAQGTSIASPVTCTDSTEVMETSESSPAIAAQSTQRSLSEQQPSPTSIQPTNSTTPHLENAIANHDDNHPNDNQCDNHLDDSNHSVATDSTATDSDGNQCNDTDSIQPTNSTTPHLENAIASLQAAILSTVPPLVLAPLTPPPLVPAPLTSPPLLPPPQSLMDADGTGPDETDPLSEVDAVSGAEQETVQAAKRLKQNEDKFEKVNIKKCPLPIKLELKIEKYNISPIKKQKEAKCERGNDSSKLFKAGKINNKFRCGFCHFLTVDLRTIKQHYVHIHTTRLLMICEPCYFVSHSKYSLIKHWKACHGNIGTMPAPVTVQIEPRDDTIVKTEAEPTESLDVALSVSSNDLNESNERDDASSTSSQLVEHNEKSHRAYMISSQNVPIICSICQFETRYAASLKSHMASMHWTVISETLVNVADNTKTYRCIKCSAIASTQKGVAVHYVDSHETVPTIRCELCDINIRDIAGLSTHAKTEMHQEYYRRSLRCKCCQFATLSKKSLQTHTSVHRRNKYKCQQCSYTTDRINSLASHSALKHDFTKGTDGMYSCVDCDFQSKSKNTLYKHMLHTPGHLTARKDVEFPCKLCPDYVSVSLQGLKIHMRRVHPNAQ